MDERIIIFRSPEGQSLRPKYGEQRHFNVNNHYSSRRRLNNQSEILNRENISTLKKNKSFKVKKSKISHENSNIDKKRNFKLGFKSMLKLFLKRSSVYALNQIGNSSTATRKVFWMLILIIGAFGCVGQISQFLIAYFKYPVVTNINTIREKYQEFPAVTVCNLNSIRKEYMYCVLNKQSYDECLYGKSDNQTIETENTSEPLCEEAVNFFNKRSKDFVWKLFLINQDSDSRTRYGHQIENFIQGCSFGGSQCDYSYFTHFVSHVYGNCYTFNYVQGSNNLFVSSPASGLELELDVEADKYTPYTDGVGARVQIHDPYLEHDIDIKGIDISPGFKTYIALSKYASERLPPPYKDHCRHYDLNDTQKMCMEKCVQDSVYSLCSCILSKKYYPGLRPCDLTKPSVVCCLSKIGDSLDDSMCDCPLPCYEAFFQYDISFSAWPSLPYYDDNKYMFVHRDGMRYLSFEEVQRTRLKVVVFFETLDFTVNKQNPMFDSSELFSQVGGQMGLWLGLTLIAIFECVENLVTLCKYRMRR